MQKKATNQHIREAVILYDRDGWSYKKIGDYLGFDQAAVYRWLNPEAAQQHRDREKVRQKEKTKS